MRESWQATTFRGIALALMAWTLHEVVQLGRDVAVLQAQVVQLQQLVAHKLGGS